MLETAELLEGKNEFLGAIQNVLQSRSAATEADLVGAAACQFLRQGPATVDVVRNAVERIWPRSQPTIEQVSSALQVSKDLGLTFWDDSSECWQLTANGLEDIQQHAGWVSGLRERTTAEIRIRSRQGLGIEPDADEAQLWLDALVAALVPAVAGSLPDHLGSAKSLIEGKIRTNTTKPLAALQSLENASPRQEIVELLQSLAVSALDPLDPFGRELVTHIATGVILHSYVAGSSGQQLSSLLGKPERQRAIIDTPILISLIGSAQEQKDAQSTIKRAVRDGWDVVVARHSLEELGELVERELPNLQHLYKEAYERNARMDFYASLVDDRFHGMVIMALQEGTYKNLQQVSIAANSLSHRLEELGVKVRDHGNEASVDRRLQCLNALNDHLARSPRKRSAKVVLRDAETMTMAWRRRRREASKNWPGAWVITSDRAMNPAYSSVSSDRVSITLTLAQWTTVLSISADPGELPGLATVAAGQYVDEAIWDLPARFPKEFAMHLATQLSPEQGGSKLDLYQAQILHPLPAMLDQIAENSSTSSLAAEVMAARARRLNALNDLDRSHRDKQIATAFVDVSNAQQGELAAQRKLHDAEQEKTKLLADLAKERSDREAEAAQALLQKKRFTRILWSIALVLAAAVWMILTIIFGGIIAQLVAGSVLVASIVLILRWCRNLESSLHVLGWTLGIEALGAVSAIQAMVFPQN